MGRPEQPLERDGSGAREVAYWLRNERGRAGLTYGQLASKTGYGTSTLQEAMAGRRLPTLQVTLAIVGACGGDIEAWRAYWAQVRRASDPSAPPGADRGVTPPWSSSAADVLPDPGGRITHWWNRRRVVLAAATGVLLVGATIAALALSSTPHHANNSFPPPTIHPSVPTAGTVATTYTEQEFNPNGAPTFLHLDASGAGLPVGYGQIVQVSCKIYNTTLASTKPDGYWYRIASMPWDNNYYAVANTFGNGDKMGGPYTHNTDWHVPDCR